MAFLYVTEGKDMRRTGSGAHIQILSDYGYDQAPVAIGGGSVQSAAFRQETHFVRINVDAACSIAFGTNPTATTNSRRMSAGQTEYFPVVGGDKLAVISNS